MTFQQALISPHFWGYSIGAGAALAAAWALLFLARLRGHRLAEGWHLFWSWVVYAGTAIPAVLLGHEVFAGVLIFVSLLGCREFARATGLYADWLFTAVVYLAILAVNGVALWAARLTDGGLAGNYGYDLFMATPIHAVAILCVLPVLRNRAEGMLPRVALAVMAFVYFGYFLAHLNLLAGLFPPAEVYGYVFFLLFGAGTTALAGDLADRRRGRRPIASRISSAKTWEGAAASLLWACVWSFGLGWTCGHFTWLTMLLCVGIFGVMGPLGDLALGFVLRDTSLHATQEPAPALSSLTLNHLNRLVFVTPLFFRAVHLAHLAG
jgi:predicted CDP-diglyceride synthetase/phosphatidate cytidylyltransferase